MKEIIFNRKEYESYKDFYRDVCIKLNKDRFIDWKGNYENLGYNGNLLAEFLWYCHNDNNKYIFVNFDKEKISLQKNYDDYEYNIIIYYFEKLIKEYPNNQLEFRMEDKVGLNENKWYSHPG